MYLQCLSPPPELLSRPPSLHDSSWSLDPPGTADFEALRGWLHDKLHDWRRQRENIRFGNNGTQNDINGVTSSSTENSPIHNEEALYYEHLSKSYQEWAELSEQAREEQWRHEWAKAYAREREKHQRTARELEHAEQEIQLLRSQIAQINSNTIPPEFVQFPPAPLPFSRETVSHLPDAAMWDPDAFIAKWRSRIQSARSTQIPLPSWPSSHQPNASNGSNRFGFLQKAAQDAQGSVQAQDEFDGDGDLEDAPGEDDDDGYEQQQEDKTLDPNLRHQTRVGGPQLRGSRRLMGMGGGYRRGADGGEMEVEGG